MCTETPPRSIIRELIRFLWLLDDHEYEHPRERVQLAALLQVLWSTGTRPNDLIGGGGGTNKGLLYKHVKFMAIRDGGKRRLAVELQLHRLKPYM